MQRGAKAPACRNQCLLFKSGTPWGKAPIRLSRTQEGADFLDLLEAMKGHPRITFGKSQAVTVGEQSVIPRLSVELLEDGAVRLQVEPLEGLLVGVGPGTWQWKVNQFLPVAAGLPAARRSVAPIPGR